MSMPATFAGDFKVETLEFGPVDDTGKQRTVKLFDQNKKTPVLNLTNCSVTKPLTARFSVDRLRDEPDGTVTNSTRRGQAVVIENKETQRFFNALDDLVVEEATKRSREFFKKELRKEEVQLRFKQTLDTRDGDPNPYMKFKIKCAPGPYPTELHLLTADGKVIENGAKIEDLEKLGAEMSPVVSVYGLWFMGGGTQFGLSIQAEKMLVKPGAGRCSLASFATSTPLVVSTKTRDEEMPPDTAEKAEGGVEEDDSKKRKREDSVPAETAEQTEKSAPTPDAA